MEEIEGRFELIRIAVHLGDYEVIDTQIRRLRNMSTDKHLHAILYELEGKNFRQALYMMKDYAETLRDDFFNPPISETVVPVTPPAPAEHRFADRVATPTETHASTSSHSHTTSTSSPARHPETVPAPEPAHQLEPTKPEPDLFNLTNSGQAEPEGARLITLDEMLEMTKESATDPRRYQAPEPAKNPKPEPEVPATAPSPEPRAAEPTVPETVVPSGELDPLFTLDQNIVSEPKPKPKPKPEPEPEPQVATLHSSKPADPTPPLETQQEEVVSSSPMDMTPLFGGGDDLGLGDDLLTFPPVLDVEEIPAETPDTVEEPMDEMGMGLDTGIFTLDEPGFFEMETPVIQETAPEVVPVPVRESVPVIAEPDETPVASVEELPSVLEFDTTPEPTRVMEAAPEPEEELTESALEMDEVPPAIVEEDPRPRRWEFEPDEDDVLYEKFSYMGQKFRNMMHQYVQREELEEGAIEEVKDFIHMVSTQDYSESQVEAAIARYQELKEQGRIAEAAQMLIAAATTESTFAQFMLARELFKGEVLQQNFPESFTQINRLAEEDYPEAICDLGQLYEYGIGIGKNKRHALLLYEEAAQMEVERAQRHYDRLRSSNPLQSIKSLTNALLRKKK